MPQNDTIDPATETTYRRLHAALWLCSGVALGGLIVAGYPLLGVGAFAACAVGAFSVYRRYGDPLFDERDQRIQEAASERTITIFGLGSAVVFPTVTALWALDVIAWPLWLTPIAFFVAALSLLHGASLAYERRWA
ncbi:DUF2178 domain-containing protein [Haloarchaeobius sp. FL176]|uniref:DUF2178 domain-containing protein n=1 Tax=Haloarchaeobius sp. FL176 TaxID=2967129 RepID=UPI002148D641|nr:DUF2178 domain-containing protein [Haloarchaeobius sp. FL176]